MLDRYCFANSYKAVAYHRYYGNTYVLSPPMRNITDSCDQTGMTFFISRTRLQAPAGSTYLTANPAMCGPAIGPSRRKFSSCTRLNPACSMAVHVSRLAWQPSANSLQSGGTKFCRRRVPVPFVVGAAPLERNGPLGFSTRKILCRVPV